MPGTKVTNYITINGQIVGEVTDGVRTDYLTDALGNVTATVDQSANIINEYRYKPFGALLSKSGVGPDPKFQWVGSLGYRKTGLAHSDYYVRARHFTAAAGLWTSKDRPLPAHWSFYYQLTHPYVYANERPVQLTDPTGLLSIHCKYAGIVRPCLKALYAVCFDLDPGDECGWVVQYREIKSYPKSCDGKDTKGFDEKLYEAWQVTSTPASVQDVYSTEQKADCGKGVATWFGIVVFYPCSEIAGDCSRPPGPGWGPCKDRLRKDFLCSNTPPDGWSGGGISHDAILQWNCCTDPGSAEWIGLEPGGCPPIPSDNDPRSGQCP